MTDTEQKREDETLRRMLKTPPKPNKPVSGDGPKPATNRSRMKHQDQ